MYISQFGLVDQGVLPWIQDSGLKGKLTLDAHLLSLSVSQRLIRRGASHNSPFL